MNTDKYGFGNVEMTRGEVSIFASRQFYPLRFAGVSSTGIRVHPCPSVVNFFVEKQKFKLIIAYDGTAYEGWQVQKIGTGVQQKVEDGAGEIVSQRAAAAQLQPHGHRRPRARHGGAF